MKYSNIFFMAIIFSYSNMYPMKQGGNKKNWLDKLKEETDQWEKRREKQNNSAGTFDTFELEKIKKFTDK